MRLHQKFTIMFLIVYLAVLAVGATGLFMVGGISEGVSALLEEKVAVADASSEITNTITGSEALLHQHMLTADPERLDQIEREMMEYHELDNMWVGAVTYGTESREFIESEEYSLWLKDGYGTEGIVIRKADPEVISIIEEVDINHKKLHATAGRLMKLHREEIEIQQHMADLYSEEELQRHRMRDLVRAQGDYLLMDDIWGVEYKGKEALFQYKDKKHTNEWIEAIETLQRDVANSTLAPEIKGEIQNYSAEYLSLAKAMSRYALKLNELDAEMQAQMDVVMAYIADIDANVADIKASSFAARADAKEEIQAYVARMYILLAVAIAIVIVLVMFTRYFTNRFMSQPIVALRDATRKTGEGDFDVRIKVDRGDEIGELNAAFNEMAEALKKRTAELAEHAEELERTNRFKETFTDILRHDLLNPIGVIGNIVEILEDDKNLRDSSEFLVIKRNVTKLEEIVYNASDYAKLESTEKLERAELDLAKVIESVIEDFGPYIEDKGMNVEFKPKGKYKASASPIIESVFVNLLSNAIKYSPAGTEIKIAIEDGGKSWKISVADRGDGVPDEYREAIFDRFTRKDKVGVKGTGFGLAIVKRIVEMHGGRGWVEDNPEGGSVFYVEIPKSGGE